MGQRALVLVDALLEIIGVHPACIELGNVLWRDQRLRGDGDDWWWNSHSDGPDHLIDVIVVSAVYDVLRIGSLDRERRGPIGGRRRRGGLGEIDVSRRVARSPPDLMQPAIRGAVDHVLRVRAGAVVGRRVAGGRGGAREPRQIPTSYRRGARPVELPEVPVLRAIDDLVHVVVRREVPERLSSGRGGAGDSREVVEPAGTIRPVQTRIWLCSLR